MTTDPIAAALNHIRSITPADSPWTAKDVAFEPQVLNAVDNSIATILNAVVAGELINCPRRDPLLPDLRGEVFASAGAEGRWIADSDAGVYDADSAQDEIARLTAEVDRLTKGSICEVAATNPSIMEYMSHWEGRTEKAETERDTLVAAAYEAAASVQVEGMDYCSPSTKAAIRALTPADAKAELEKMLAEARLAGWRAGREAAAEICDDTAMRKRDPAISASFYAVAIAIRAMPEPKEADHD